MASNNEEFIQYHIFLKNIVKSIIPQNLTEAPLKTAQMRNRISTVDAEGEVIYWILKYLDEKKCPTKLIAPIVRNVLVEIQSDPAFIEPNDLRNLATTIVQGFCRRLLDNVELNNIIDTAKSPELNDDLLSIPIRTAGSSINGRRKMEDRTICVDEFHKVYDVTNSAKTTSFYGVFDGHGGYTAAHYAACQLPYNFSTTSKQTTDPVTLLQNAFEKTDSNFKLKGASSGGTTAVCALYHPEDKCLFIAWAGDSQAMLAKKHGKIMQLVTSHRPDLEREKHRIKSSGGFISSVSGIERVKGTLNVTRSLGDVKLKKYVVSHPDCVVVDLDGNEEFLVMATDGLWDHAHETEIARTVYDCIKEDCENLDLIPSRLIKLAQDGQSSDNISVVVIFFKHPSQIAKNCDNLTIMESEFDNIKEVEYYDYSRNFYPSDENSTSNPHAVDSKQMRWTPNDNLNNIISDEVSQTTTTTTTTSTTTNNGQFDDNLLNSSDNIDLNQKLSPLVGSGDDNSLHHASTLENNGEEFLATGGYDNKNRELLTPTTTQFDDNDDDHKHQKILEKNQPHHAQQLVDTDGDYGPETCVDVTDDVVMMTENSADTNNLSEQSTLSHSKDTLPSSDNCNPFDNKNAMDMEETNEYQLGHAGVDAHLHLDDANKATPLLSPEVEDLPLTSDGQMHFTNEGYQQSPLEDEIPVGIGSRNQFEDEFMQSNGHLSPIEVKDNEEVGKEQKDHIEEHQEEIDSLAKLERFGDPEETEVQNMSNLKPELVENFFGNPIDSEGVIKDKEIISNNVDNDDENDFRLKDEEEILEKHVVESEFAVKESEALDLSQKDQLQQSLHNLEDDILEEKPILTGNYVEEEINFNESPMKFAAEDDEKLSEFADEKQDKEEFSEKEDKVEEKLLFVEQKSAPSEDIELEEDDCIHLEEDVHPSDYLAMLEKQKEEQHQQLGQVDEGFEKEGQFEEDEPKIHSDNGEEQQQKPLIEEDNKVIDKVMEKEDTLPQQLHLNIDNELGENGIDKEQHQADEKLDEQVEEMDRNEHYDMDESISAGTEQQEKERHLDDIEIMSQQFDRFEKEDGLKSDQQLDNESVTEMVQNDQRYESEEFEKIEELQKQLQQPEEFPMHEEIVENNKLESEVASLIEEQISLIEDSIVQPEKQCFEEPEKIPGMQEIVDLVSQLEQSIGIDEEMAAAGEELENKFLDEQSFEETKKEIEECNTLDELENKFVESNEKQLQDIVAFEQDQETNISDQRGQTYEQLENQFVENLKNHLQDSDTLEELGNNLLDCNEKTLDEPTYEELEKQFVESNEKQLLDIVAFGEELEKKSFEEAEKQFLECSEEQLQKIEQEVLDAKPVSAERPERVIQPFEEPDIDPENLVEVEEPMIVKEQVQIKPSALPVSAQEPSAVPPTQESCDESEDDEWKYKKEGQGEKQLGVQGDTVVEEELPQQPHEASETFSIHERKASGNILQQQISINTSNLIESINDTFEGLTQNISELAEQATELAEQAAAADKKIEQGLQNLNLSQSSTREKLDNIEDEDDEELSASEMNSRLNPEAKEFVPTMSPPASSPKDLANGFDGQAPKAIPQHFKDEVISSSPRKGRESNMEDINIPAENEFDQEIAHKPHGLPDDEAIVEPTENGNGLFQELNWKEAMHGSEKEEGPLVDSPVTEESLEVVDNVKQFGGVQEFSAPVDLDNAGMKQSIYIENNTSNDELNTVQLLPEEEIESANTSLEITNKEENDVISKEGVQEILTLASDDKIESKAEAEIEQKMEQLLLSHDKELTKDFQMETEQVPINGVEMAPEEPVKEQLVAVAEPVIEQANEAIEAANESVSSPVPVAEEPSNDGLALGAAVAVVAAATTATTAAVKKVEAEKNQKNLKKTSSATKSKVPDTKKPAVGTAAKTTTASSLAAKRTSTDKPKPAAASSLAAKKTVSSTVSAAPRPRLATASATAGGAKTPTEKKTTTSTTSTVKSRIDAKPPTSLATRKPLTSSAAKTTASKPGEETKSSSSTVKSSTVGKTSLGAKPSIGSARTTSTTNSLAKPRPATAPSTATTNGIASKTAAAPKPSTLAPKSAGTIKSSITSPRGTLTSTLRKTEAVKSPTKTTTSTITSRVSTNGVPKSTTTTRTSTTKTTSSTVPATTATRTTTSSLHVTGTKIGATTPTNSKTNSNLVPRKSTPLKKTITNSSTTPTARKSIGSKLNSPATKPTKDTSTPRPVTIPAHHQNHNSIAAEESKNAAAAAASLLAAAVEEPKLNGNASPDDVLLPPLEAAPVAVHPLIEMDTV